MNRGLQGMMMLHSLNKSGCVSISKAAELTVLERQRSRIKWQQQGLVSSNVNSLSAQGGDELQGQLSKVRISMVNPESGLDIAWTGHGYYGMPSAEDFQSCGYVDGTGVDYSCPVVSVVGESSEGQGSILIATEGGIKRKAERALKAVSDDDTKEMKKIKEWAEDGESKVTQHSRSANNKTRTKNKDRNKAGEALRDALKVSEAQKTDYIHVRARRGEATDSHSLAERVRREKISERMKYLQELVPGCNKITGKAGMLDEIINYVQSLQRQVEFLSMKLATFNPQLNFSNDSLFGKEVITPSTSSYPAIRELSEIANPAYLEFNPSEEAVSSGLDIGNYQPEMGLQQPLPETYVDATSFSQNPSAWDAELHNLLAMEFQGGYMSFPSQPRTGREQ